MKRFLLISLAALFVATTAVAQTAREEIDKYQHIAMASFSTYAAPYFAKPIAKAPKGYKPFYISHYGRHGSRHESTQDYPNSLVEIFRVADSLGILTAKGKEVKKVAEEIYVAHKDRIGELTRIGFEQHKGIARRMYARFKPVFKSGSIIDSRSSNYTRCILSMAAFNESLKECKPMLETRMDAAEEHQNVVRPIRSATSDYTHKQRIVAPHAWRDNLNKWMANKDFSHSLNALFTDADLLSKHLNEMKHFIILNIYKRLIFMQNLGWQNLPLIDSIFTADERFYLYLFENYRWYAFYTCATLPDSKRYFAPMYHLVDDIINRADRAIEGKNSASADLRFGHDYYLLGMIAVMNANEIPSELDISSIEQLGETWKSYRVVSMASNLQFVFYRSKKCSDILVRVLENENDITFPIKSVEGPFYKWEDLRKYLNDRAQSFRK